MHSMERMMERELQFLAANDTIGLCATTELADHAHHALFGVEDGRKVLDVLGWTGV